MPGEVEAAARAIYRSDTGGTDRSFDVLTPFAKERFRAMARAALHYGGGSIRSQERQRVREALLGDEAIREMTKEIVEGSNGEVISLPYAVVKDALTERLAALDSLEDSDG